MSNLVQPGKTILRVTRFVKILTNPIVNEGCAKRPLQSHSPTVYCSLALRYSYAKISRTVSREALYAGKKLASADKIATMMNHATMPSIETE